MSPRARRQVRRQVDINRIAHATRMPGNDTRVWTCMGTVATVGGDGGPDFADGDAVLITPSGVRVDVILDPYDFPLPCRYGILCGSVYIATPIHPGDLVAVQITDGDPAAGGVIIGVLSSDAHPIPIGDDGKPVFQNDRILIHGRGVPVDVRTDGGNQINVKPNGDVEISSDTTKIIVGHDGTIKIGGATATQKLVLGNLWRTAETTRDTAIAAAALTLAGVVTSSSGEVTGVFASTYPNTAALILANSAAIAAIAAAIAAYETPGPTGYLSADNATE